MRKYAWLILSIGFTFSLVGCADEENGGGGGGSAGSGGSGGSGTMVAVTGTVRESSTDDLPGPTVANATVSVVGSNSTTTDPAGNFSLMAPTGTRLFLTEATGNWGSLFAEIVPVGGISGLEVEVIPDALVDEIADGFTTSADTAKGIVAVVFDETTTVGGETASISATSELSFVFDDQEEPVETDTLIAGGGSEVIFLNVDLADTVTASATSTAQQGCPPEFQNATYSVLEKVLTEIDVVCAVQQ